MEIDIKALESAIADAINHPSELLGVCLTVKEAQAVLALLKEQEPPTSDELKVQYGKMYKCKGCGLEWYQQAQRYCQHCGRSVKLK